MVWNQKDFGRVDHWNQKDFGRVERVLLQVSGSSGAGKYPPTPPTGLSDLLKFKIFGGFRWIFELKMWALRAGCDTSMGINVRKIYLDFSECSECLSCV